MFKRTKENFICEHCGHKVIGDGYTNHCPQCLFSKHVDIEPGDRQAFCGGLMRPVSIEKEGGGYKVVHRCTACGHEKRNKVQKGDTFEPIRLSDIS